jgi:hypothetical protein
MDSLPDSRQQAGRLKRAGMTGLADQRVTALSMRE